MKVNQTFSWPNEIQEIYSVNRRANYFCRSDEMERHVRHVVHSASNTKTDPKPGENHLILNLTKQNGSTIRFRVAADTCIGRSEFSEIMDDETASADVDDATNTDRESVCSATEIFCKFVFEVFVGARGKTKHARNRHRWTIYRWGW